MGMNLDRKPHDKKHFSWSYSKWKSFSECKRKYMLMTYKKEFNLPAQIGDTYNLDRGIAIHKEAEGYVKGEITGLPKSLSKFKPEFLSLLKQKSIAEDDWWMDRNWKRIPKFDWDNLWIIIKVDAHGLVDQKKRLRMVDYKTGREYPSHEDQAEIYAAAGYCIYETIEEVRTEFWYIDQDKTTPFFYHSGEPEDLEGNELYKLKYKWTVNGIELEDTTLFEPNPAFWTCKFCNANQIYGGPCHDACNERD